MQRKAGRIHKGIIQWQCSKCLKWKNEDNFHSSKKAWNGIASGCKECHKSAIYTYRDYKRNIRARQIARTAIRKGRIKKAKLCTDCRKVNKTEMHHPDYTKPLKLIWLCQGCHRKRHRTIGKAGLLEKHLRTKHRLCGITIRRPARNLAAHLARKASRK